MFSTMSSLTSLDLSSVNTIAATNMTRMFRFTAAVTSLDLSNFDTTIVTNMNDIFEGTTLLTRLNVTDWNIGNSSGRTNVFLNANTGLVVTCNQGGGPATGAFFGETCF